MEKNSSKSRCVLHIPFHNLVCLSIQHLTRTKTYAFGSDAVNRARLVGVMYTKYGEEMIKAKVAVFGTLRFPPDKIDSV